MYNISREFWFCASHRIEGHPKCGRLHGHNYLVTVSVSGPLDTNGMVMDFGDLDSIVKPLIDMLDHYTLFSISNIKEEPELFELCKKKGWSVELPITHTTAEELAQFIHDYVWERLPAGYGPENITIKVQETERNVGAYAFAFSFQVP